MRRVKFRIGGAGGSPALPPDVPVSWGLPLAQRFGCGGGTREIRYINCGRGCSKNQAEFVVRHPPKTAIVHAGGTERKPAIDCARGGAGRTAETRLTISLHGAMDPLVSRAAMMYAAIHGRQKKVGAKGSGTHAAPDDISVSDARRGPFWSQRASEGVAGPALRTSGDVDADSGDRNDVRYVPKRPGSSPDCDSSPRIRFNLHLCAERISHRPRTTRFPFHDSSKLSRRPRHVYQAIDIFIRQNYLTGLCARNTLRQYVPFCRGLRGWEGGMTCKPGVAVVRASVSARELEVLLLRASECTKASPLRLVKQPQAVSRPDRRSPRSAA